MTSHFIRTSVTSKMTSNVVLLSVFVTFLLTGATFFTAGWFSQKPFNDNEGTNYMENTLDTFSIQDDFDAVNNETLYENLKMLTKIPHLAGDTRDHVLANFIKDKFNEYGLDHAEIKEYNVLLDYPNKTAPNLITLSNENGILYESVYQEEGFEDDVLKNDDNFIDAYLAYSKAGIAEGKLVYVNYGSKRDFELLANQSSPFYTDVTGKICITRYGQVFRGNKAKNAEVAGCSGLIIFSDPADVAGEGQDLDTDVYPHTMFLPDTGIQRGSLLLTDGDPQTPNWPSLEHTERLSIDELVAQGLLPKIPCQAIGYRGAKELMKHLGGTSVPKTWIGGLSGVEYFIGGDFKAECGEECNVRIVTNNILETKQSPNVMGYIRGSHEPDRYVMIGNHRDAWGYGALDPSSGTTQMLEISRILGGKLANGWRPRRTIVFLSWGSEEFGLIGSREFVEDFRRKLIERGVVYINSDTAVSGPIMWAEASPTISHKVVEAAKKVPYKNHDSYYDFWKQWLDLDQDPEIWIPGAGSDHASFIFHAGVPVMDFGFGPDTKLHPSVANIGYPTYHTAYETFQLMTDIVDPNFEMLSVSTKITLSIVRDFAEKPILDFNLRGYQPTMEAFKTDPEIAQLENLGIKTEYFLSALDTFQNATENWTERFEEDLEELQNHPLLAKAINDQMMNLDKNFLLDVGLPGRPIYSHAIMSPSQFDSYGSGYFPGISDTLYDFDSQDQTEQERRKAVLKKHLSDLMIVILRACDHLKPLDRL